MKTVLQVIAQNIRIHRARHGWSQEVLAELSGVHRNQVGHIERCEHAISVIMLDKLAKGLEVPITDLLIDSYQE